MTGAIKQIWNKKIDIWEAGVHGAMILASPLLFLIDGSVCKVWLGRGLGVILGAAAIFKLIDLHINKN